MALTLRRASKAHPVSSLALQSNAVSIDLIPLRFNCIYPLDSAFCLAMTTHSLSSFANILTRIHHRAAQFLENGDLANAPAGSVNVDSNLAKDCF